MTSTELSWNFFGNRKVRPYSFALSLASSVLVWSLLSESAVGAVLDGVHGKIIGLVSALTVVLLFAGFWMRSDRMMANGLLLSTGVWSTATVTILFDVGVVPSMLLAGCWAIASAGAWLLEIAETRKRD